MWLGGPELPGLGEASLGKWGTGHPGRKLWGGVCGRTLLCLRSPGAVLPGPPCVSADPGSDLRYDHVLSGGEGGHLLCVGCPLPASPASLPKDTAHWEMPVSPPSSPAAGLSTNPAPRNRAPRPSASWVSSVLEGGGAPGTLHVRVLSRAVSAPLAGVIHEWGWG